MNESVSPSERGDCALPSRDGKKTQGGHYWFFAFHNENAKGSLLVFLFPLS